MNPEQPQQDPLLIIEGLRQQIYMMGANDVENSQIDLIISRYKKGDISAEESIQQVTEILNNKQDYH